MRKRDDSEAFCELSRGYQRRIYSLALHYCRDPHDAEDLSQEVWLKAFKSLGGFRREASHDAHEGWKDAKQEAKETGRK